jgi:acetyl-CoA acetyltransferase
MSVGSRRRAFLRIERDVLRCRAHVQGLATLCIGGGMGIAVCVSTI